MSVLKNKRNKSDLEFFNTAVILRREMTLLLLRDFGIKDKVRSINAITLIKRMNEEDAEKFRELAEKYQLTNIIDEYPEWLINEMRRKIMSLLETLIDNITQANSIYPRNETEYYDRRTFQNHAIGNCKRLLQEMQYILSIIPVDANKYMKYVNLIVKEVELLKSWRKSDNKILQKLKETK